MESWDLESALLLLSQLGETGLGLVSSSVTGGAWPNGLMSLFALTLFLSRRLDRVPLPKHFSLSVPFPGGDHSLEHRVWGRISGLACAPPGHFLVCGCPVFSRMVPSSKPPGIGWWLGGHCPHRTFPTK